MFRSKNKPQRRTPWNKGKLVGQKSPFTMQEIWSIRMRLQTIGNRRDLALFNLAIDSKLRGCDLVRLRVSDVASGGEILSRATVRQRKTKRAARRYESEFGIACPDGFRRFRVHDLKHTYGRRLRAAGVSLEDRQDLLGHKSGKITTEYSAPELANLMEASNRVCGEKSRKTPALTLIRTARNIASL